MSFIRAHLFPENIGPKIIWEDDRDIDVINIYIYKSFKSTTKPLKPVKQSRTWICPAVFRGELGKIFATFKQSMTFVFFFCFVVISTRRETHSRIWTSRHRFFVFIVPEASRSSGPIMIEGVRFHEQIYKSEWALMSSCDLIGSRPSSVFLNNWRHSGEVPRHQEAFRRECQEECFKNKEKGIKSALS